MKKDGAGFYYNEGYMNDTEQKCYYNMLQENSELIKTAGLIREKFNRFIAQQKDAPEEFVNFLNKNFWDLI